MFNQLFFGDGCPYNMCHNALNSPLTPVELPSYVLKEATTLSLKADIHLSINSTNPTSFLFFSILAAQCFDEEMKQRINCHFLALGQSFALSCIFCTSVC